MNHRIRIVGSEVVGIQGICEKMCDSGLVLVFRNDHEAHKRGGYVKVRRGSRRIEHLIAVLLEYLPKVCSR